MTASFSVSMNVPVGKYELLLQLSDPISSLSKNPDYNILLLNSGVAETTTGLNNLKHFVTVSSLI